MSSVNPFEQNVDIYNKKISSSKTINTNQSSEVSESAQIDTSGSIYSESSDSKQYSNGLSVENDSEIDSNTYNVIKEQLENEIEQKKQALKDKKDDRGWATSLWNGAKELFGGGDKAELKEIENLEEELKTLETEPDNLDAVYKSIMGKDLSAEEISKIKNSSSLVSSLDSSTKQAIITELENQYEQIEDSLETAKSSNGWISGAWDKFKNWTGIGASSNKSETQLDNMKEQLDSLKENPDNLAEVYKNITGKDFTTDELNKFISGETSLVSESKAAESVSKYSEGQKMATDIVADVVSGIAAVGAIAAAPFTGGASLLLAAGVGAGVKVGLKASDCIGNEKTYGLSDLAYDSVTGSINGMFAPISNGLGGAAGTGVAKAFGLEAAENTVKTALKQTAKTVGKEAAEEVLEQGAKQAGKSTISKILAKQGTEYVLKEGAESTLKTTIGKVAAYGTDMVVDGALSGATDGFARALGEGRIEDIPQDTLNGLAGGAVASPLIGGGFRLATKGGSKIGNMIGKSDIGDSVADEVSDKSKSSFLNKAGELKDAASDKLHKAGDKIKNSNAYQKAGELKHAAADKLHQTGDKIKSSKAYQKASELKHAASDKLHQAGDKIKNSTAYQKAGELKDAAKDKLHQAGDKIKNSTAYQKAGKLKDAAKDKFHQMAEEYNSTRELMAEDGVSFKDLAADKLHQTGDKIKSSKAYQKAGELKHAASDKLHKAGDKIKNSTAYQKAGELKDAAKDKFHQMAEEYNSTRELMAEDGASFKDLAADKLHQTGDKIKNSKAYQKAGELKHAASDKLHQAGDKIKNSTAYQKAGELKHAASDKLHQAGDKIKNSTAYQKAGELKDSMKTSIKSKLKETKVGKKLVQDYKIAKSNFMNIPQNNSVDAQLVQDLAQFAKKAQEFLDSSNTSLNNHFTNFENTFSNLTTSVDDVIGDISSIRNKILVSSSEKSAMVKELLEEIRAGKDVSPKIIELIDKGIDLTDLFDENLLKVTTDLEDKLGKVSTYSQEYNKSVENLMEILSERTDEATGLANEAINVIKEVPDTNAFKQLGDLPERTKIFATKIQEDISSLKSKSEAAKAKILGGNIEEGLQDLEKYYDEVEVFQSKLEQASIDAQTTAERSGFIETISTLKDRIQSKLNSQGFSSMSKTAQTQSIIEESNIAFSKFIQTMSSDENLPPQVQSFFKEFTSNCTVTRDLAEAQKFADELYGAGKYTLKKSFGAGTVGETYLVTDAEGKEFVMKMLKKGVSEEKFEADRAMFTKYIEEFISDEADKEYKLKLINGLFDSWEKELDYGLEAAGAKNMLDGAKRFNVAQTVEIGTKEGRNISLVMEKADGVGLDTLLDLLKFKNENPTDYMTKSILNDEGKELNPWIKNKKLIEQNSWIKDTESYREALPVAYQKAQNEQAMFLSKKGIKTVHADPHGGNVFVDFDTKTKTPKITYIDTGNVVQRTNSEVLSDISLSLNMLIGNSEGIAHSLIQGATLPAGATQEEMAKKMADLLDERLYKAGINLKDVNYTQSTINNIMKELNIIPDAGNSNLMKATLQRIKTSREIFSVTGTEANKAIDIKDMLKGIAQSFKTNPKETYKTIKPIIKWAYKNKDQTLITFFQMMLKNSDFENIN